MRYPRLAPITLDGVRDEAAAGEAAAGDPVRAGTGSGS